MEFLDQNQREQQKARKADCDNLVSLLSYAVSVDRTRRFTELRDRVQHKKPYLHKDLGPTELGSL